MKVRAYKMQVREIGDTGTFTGYASVFGNVDWYGTVVDRGAFGKTIKDNDGTFPLLYFHDPVRPIGMLKATEDDKGLLVEGSVDMGVPDGNLAYRGLKGGYIDRMSIGFDVVTEEMKDEVPHFREIRLWEASLITRNFAANPEALVTDVRGACAGLQRVNSAIRAGATEELREAMDELRALLGTTAEQDEMERFRSELTEGLSELKALMVREGPSMDTPTEQEPPADDTEPQSHSVLDELRTMGQQLNETLTTTR